MDDQKTEQQRVNRVIKKINQQEEHVQNLYDQAHHETRQVEQNYTQNAKVNLIEADDRIETNAEIQQQKGLVARAVENESILKKQIEELKELKNSPYFGRIDIKDEPNDETESLYIGVSSFADQDGNFLIYDWRAPISSIYYNGTLGKVQYQTPSGLMETDLIKKRQFQINHGNIVHMFDTNETVGDELLQQALGEQNDESMRNIVATIQKEQNDIIRDVKSDLLVVQGVAGSGKTSAILQRIAFLLYHSRTSLNADEIVLFSPNRLYSRYIADVLPSLGERNMRQLTFAEFLDRRLEGLQVQTLFNRFENESSSNDPSVVFKEDATYMHQIKQYEESLTSNQICFADLNFQGETFFKKADIKSIFEQWPLSMSNKERVLKTKNELIKRLQLRLDDEIKTDRIQDKINQISDEKYREIVGRRHFNSYEKENYFIGHYLVEREFQIIDDAIFNNYFIDIYAQYADFLSNFTGSVNNQKNLVDTFNNDVEIHQIRLEDATPLMYLRDLLTGSGTNRKFQHVFIDEMQDYTMAQLLYLKHAFPKAKFTLLGDSQQALFKSVQQPTTLLNQLKDAFNVKRSNLITLNQSYRSTLEITNFAASLLPEGNKIQPFSRHGDLPKLTVADSLVQWQAILKNICHEELDKFGTVAILTKNMTDSNQIANKLRKLHPHLLTDGDRTLPKGIVILPIYLAKGLEFDSVIIADASFKSFPNKTWAGTLYTMASRAMHHLNLISLGPVSPLIYQVDSQWFIWQKSFKLSNNK